MYLLFNVIQCLNVIFTAGFLLLRNQFLQSFKFISTYLVISSISKSN